MDRRESLKTLLVGTVAGGAMVSGCDPKAEDNLLQISEDKVGLYGRTEKEKARDKDLFDSQFFTEKELVTIAVLCDIILPATSSDKGASEVNVPDFVEFIAKDLPYHQHPLRGGLMWLDHQSNARFNRSFSECNQDQMLELVEEIAYPKPKNSEMEPGVNFFDRMRNLTLTGYYTSQEGIRSLGYMGNIPNVWDGVPEEILKKHDLTYDEEWLSKCVDQKSRNVKAEWDEDGNLLT